VARPALPDEDQISSDRKRRQEHKGVEVALSFETQRLLEDFVQLSPGDERSDRRHRTDEPTDHARISAGP